MLLKSAVDRVKLSFERCAATSLCLGPLVFFISLHVLFRNSGHHLSISFDFNFRFGQLLAL